MKRRRFLLWTAATLLIAPATVAQIYSFKGGVRIAAGSCPAYVDTYTGLFNTTSGGLYVTNSVGSLQVRSVCALPVPEKATLRQFVLVGHVTQGEILSDIYIRPWNGGPRSGASLSLLPGTPYEIPSQNQQKVVRNLPLPPSGGVIAIDRSNTYFIETVFRSPSIVDWGALQLFYYEIYWN